MALQTTSAQSLSFLLFKIFMQAFCIILIFKPCQKHFSNQIKTIFIKIKQAISDLPQKPYISVQSNSILLKSSAGPPLALCSAFISINSSLLFSPPFVVVALSELFRRTKSLLVLTYGFSVLFLLIMRNMFLGLQHQSLRVCSCGAPERNCEEITWGTCLFC